MNAAVGVSDRERTVAFHKTSAGESEVTVRAPTFSGRAGKVFPDIMVSLFFVEVRFRIRFLDMAGFLLVERRRDILFVLFVLPERGDLRVLRLGARLLRERP